MDRGMSMKCSGCNQQMKATNCQRCFLVEQKRRKITDAKYTATLELLDKFYASALNIISPKPKSTATSVVKKDE